MPNVAKEFDPQEIKEDDEEESGLIQSSILVSTKNI